MTIQFLANENFPRPALLALRASGIVIEAVGESMPGASDRTVLAHAVANNQWLVTFDRDYGELVFARAVAAPPAIVYLRQGSYAPDWPARVIRELLNDPAFVVGNFVVVSGQSVRRRRLPKARSA